VSGPSSVPSTNEPALPVAELYRDLSERLEQIVRFDVRAPESVVEEACQFAWGRLVDHRHRVRRETALSWLARTAVREALKLHAHARRCISLDMALDADRAAEMPTLAGPDELLERRERLASIRRLPARQQQMLWLHALGLTYAEIGRHTGCTTRTVERQLLRAKRALREAAD
jgi:RNA polymerase sigma factor (sigma-70 family)